MQLIVDMVPIDGHQVEGHVSSGDMGTPIVRVLETTLRTGDATEPKAQVRATGTTSNGRSS